MIDVLVMLEVVKWLASDLHYNSTGPMFYALHLLADRVKDFGSAEDDLKEGFWLGCLDTTPPADREIANLTVAAYDKVIEGKDCPVARLLAGLMNLGSAVDNIKKDTSLNGGVHAILDDIRKRVNTYTFLVRAQAQKDVSAVQAE